MWRVIPSSELGRGNYMQAATFTADISTVAARLKATVTHASEDTGAMQAICLASPEDQFAILVSHECGDPRSIEIRLNARAGKEDWVISKPALIDVLASIGLGAEDCTWVCPLVLPDGDA